MGERHAYQYDGAGNITAIGGTTYQYDPFSRLTGTTTQRANGGFSSVGRSYDDFGNHLTSAIAGCGATTPQPQGCYWSSVIPFTVSGTTNHYNGTTYDEAGNVTGDGREFSYDAVGMATRAVINGRDYRYLYSADDERVATVERVTVVPGDVRNRTTWTLRGFGNEVLSVWRDDSTSGTRQFTWTNDEIFRGSQLLGERAPSCDRHFHLDHLGTPRAITNAAGTLLGTPEFDAFGGGGASDGGPLQYTGHERDAALYADGDRSAPDSMHARMGGGGRFLSVDPVLDVKRAPKSPQMWNRYAYVLNNPVRNTDPTGRVVVVQGGSTAEKGEMLAHLMTIVQNKAAAQYLTVDKFNRLTVKGMSVGAWAKQFGGSGNVSQMAALIQSSHKVGVGFSNDPMTVAKGGGGWAPVSRGYCQVTLDRGSFPQLLGGVTQYVTTALAHELFGHAMMDAGLLKGDTGTLHPNVALSQFKIMHETDPSGMWAENQYRAMVGFPLRPYYGVPGDYTPPPEP